MTTVPGRSMQRAGDAAEAGEVPKPHDSLSQLLARILDQLSLSAWLPAAVLVSLLVFLSDLRTARGDFGSAIDTLTSMNLASFVLLLGAVIVATVLTQAFEFEAIRLLEGYWGPRPAFVWLRQKRCHRHLAKRSRIVAAREQLDECLFAVARHHMRQRGVPQRLIDLLEASRCGDIPDDAAPDELARAMALPWRSFANPDDLRRRDILAWAEDFYPRAASLVSPTVLGNTLRAYEEPILKSGETNLEGYVLKVFHRLPAALQSEHDQYRTRLDLYCSLVIVFALLMVIAPAILSSLAWTFLIGSAAVAGMLAWMCYRAAVASARGYGNALRTIGEIRPAE
jgi:hypothetical protein